MVQNSDLKREIALGFDALEKIVTTIPPSQRQTKTFDGTGGKVSAADLIAYQIGWGKCLIRWYEAGIRGESPEMPGEGFEKWDYVAIARHFYQKYFYDGSDHQLDVFKNVVSRILAIIDKEEQTGRLDQIGVWPWCTLPSNKPWPLSKWIRVNTVAPYKRAVQILKRLAI